MSNKEHIEKQIAKLEEKKAKIEAKEQEPKKDPLLKRAWNGTKTFVANNKEKILAAGAGAATIITAIVVGGEIAERRGLTGDTTEALPEYIPEEPSDGESTVPTEAETADQN